MTALLQLAFRNILRQRRRTVLLGLGIVLGSAILLLGLAFVEGVQKQLFDNVLVHQTGNFVLHHPSNQVAISPMAKPNLNFDAALVDNETLESDLVALPGVRQVQKQVTFSGSLIDSGGTTQVEVVGLSGLKGESLAALIGAGNAAASGDGIYLSRGLSEELNVGTGSEVQIFARNVHGEMVRTSFRVSDILDDPAPWLSNRIYIPLAQAQRILGISGKSMEWLVYAETNAPHLYADLVASAQKASDVKVSKAEEVGGFYAGAILGFKVLMVVNLLFLFIIVAMSMTNVMLMAVLERTREIGTLLAIGTPRWRVALMVVLEALLLTFIGVAVGALIAYIVGVGPAANGIDLKEEALRYTVGGTRVFLRFTAANLSITFGVMLTVIFLAALYPAVKSASWSPIRALRGEH